MWQSSQSSTKVVNPGVRFLLFSFRAGISCIGADQGHSSLLFQLQEFCCNLTATQWSPGANLSLESGTSGRTCQRWSRYKKKEPFYLQLLLFTSVFHRFLFPEVWIASNLLIFFVSTRKYFVLFCSFVANHPADSSPVTKQLRQQSCFGLGKWGGSKCFQLFPSMRPQSHWSPPKTPETQCGKAPFGIRLLQALPGTRYPSASPWNWAWLRWGSSGSCVVHFQAPLPQSPNPPFRTSSPWNSNTSWGCSGSKA